MSCVCVCVCMCHKTYESKPAVILSTAVQLSQQIPSLHDIISQMRRVYGLLIEPEKKGCH